MLRQTTLATLLSLSLSSALANGIFQVVSGDVRTATAGSPLAAVSANSRLIEGATVVTGANGRATIRLDDGHAMVLVENTEFVLNAYKFDRAAPASSNIAVQLLRGALRSISGLIGGKNPGQFALRTATTTIGIRGTDLVAAISDSAAVNTTSAEQRSTFVSVTEGIVDLSNSAGTAQVATGGTAVSTSAQSVALIVPSSALPATVLQTINQLNSVAIAAGTGAVGSSGATASAAGGGFGLGAAVGALAAAAALAAESRSGSSATGTTGTTGTR